MPGEYAAIGHPQGPATVQGGRPDRHRLARRRHLRQGRRAGAGGLPARGRAREALRPQARRRACCATSAPPTTPRRPSPCSRSGSRTRCRRATSRAGASPGRTAARCATRTRWPGAAARCCRCRPRRWPDCCASRRRPPTRCWCRRASRSAGHPLFVAGPQVGYFNPQILMEEDVHAPASSAGPGIDAAGAAFVGINLYVQLGRGRDYAWSATSAGQDIIDTFALPAAATPRTTATAAAASRSRCCSGPTAGRRTRPTRPRRAPRRSGPSARSSASSPAAARSTASR